jgi:PPE-repeat protein
VIDYGMFPPEINSARIYAGPGSGPMLAAATAWEGLAAELSSAASSYGSAVSGLTSGPWLGPASISMAAAAAPYVGWMNTTAAQVLQTAGQAQAAASAFEAAFAATVPPPVIAANRAQLVALVATNFLGQNTPAIMATEAQYGEMWAQDAAAMYGYAGSSAVASQVTPWPAPLQNTNVGGLAAQHAAAAQAQTISMDPQLLAAVPQALQSLASPAASTSSASGLLGGLLGGSGSASALLMNLANPADLFVLMYPGIYGVMLPTQMMGVFSQMAARMGAAAPALGGLAANAAKPLQLMAHGLGGMAPGLGGLGSGVHPAVSAGMGQANMLGALSVPQSWAPATPVNPAAALAGAGGGALREAGAGPASMYSGVPWGAPGAGHAAGLGVNGLLKVGPRRFMMPRPFAAG